MNFQQYLSHFFKNPDSLLIF